MSPVAHQEGDFSLFHLFGVVSGTLQPLLASYGLFCVVPFFTNNDVTEYFDSKFANLLRINFMLILIQRIESVIIKWDSLK